MKLSADRILTTHVGSLPRPADLLDLMEAREKGEDHDTAVLARRTEKAVEEIVAAQIEAGIDIVSDGEMSKISYTFYVRHRLEGIGESTLVGGDSGDEALHQDYLDHPDFHERMKARGDSWFMRFTAPHCIAPVRYGDRAPLTADLDNFAKAIGRTKPVDAFLNAASPGVLTKFVPNDHYGSEDAYVAALADAMKEEYEAIHGAGFVLQIDCPDLASARHNQYRRLSDSEFLKIAARNVEALNHATANIPRDAMRMHICWGNYEGPHTHDIPFAKILTVIRNARPQAVSFEGANPRHEHEWEDLRDAHIPDDMVLIPGVLDSTTNFVEHPQLIAQRIGRYADIVGRERVLAGADCGFSTFAGREPRVTPSVTWAKFRALSEGAAIASGRLWG